MKRNQESPRLWVVEQVDEFGRGWPLIDYARTKRRDAAHLKGRLAMSNPNEQYRVRKYVSESGEG